MVVCNEEYRFVIAEQLRLLGTSGTIVLEPFGRNTAPALTLAALSAIKHAADPVLLVMPADHVITDVAAFQRVVSQGATLAAKGVVVTFGITPMRRKPATATSRAGHRLIPTPALKPA